jgi:GIY-YIG catalytic domain/Zinc knuckle
MTIIYIIKLEHEKYYVGKTKELIKRLDEHFNNEGSEWTKIHKPIDIVEQHDNCDNFDEDKFTLKMMAQYGIDNVRGGSFVTINLTLEQKNMITKMLRGSEDKCFICGETDHFAIDCRINREKYQFDLGTSHDKKYCTRCGRNTHTETDCYAKKHLKGHFLPKKDPGCIIL